ncbi:MAG: ECF RNA polymerase sigma factor SigK [Mycobacteriaceae bacterium]
MADRSISSARRATLETQLVASSAGDAKAFADLYDRVAPRLYGLVLRVLRNPHYSEEVTQDVLLEIWQTSHLFDPERGSALGWLFTVAHRRAVDRVRQHEASQRRDAAVLAHSHDCAFDETATGAHASLAAAEVRAALATLSPLQREALELAYFGGFTHTEVSRLLHLPLGTAKTRIRDGLIMLRKTMASATAEPA